MMSWRRITHSVWVIFLAPAVCVWHLTGTAPWAEPSEAETTIARVAAART